jgi:hypothetical protein
MSKYTFPKSTKDTLLHGLTIEDLITSVISNIPKEKINNETVKKEFNDLLKQVTRNAYETLRDNMTFILDESIY